VKTRLFQRSTAFSRALRWSLRRTILPLTSAERRAAYAEQFDDSSRNLEIVIEGLGQLINRHTLKTATLSRGVVHWWSTYFSAQRGVKKRDRFLVYTERDHAVPFVPDQDILYAYMVTQVAFLANEMAEVLTRPELADIAQAFMELNRTGAEAFDRYPTVMPRFVDHDRLSLRVVQYLDAPVNCCPSLHIAYALLLDNLARTLGERLADKADVLESVRTSTVGMFNSVLYTKQHALLDVAFGILCAREVFEAHYDGEFDDLTSVFPELAREHAIPYDAIVQMLDEATALRRTTDSLADALGRYLAIHGFVKVGPDEDIADRYFDMKKRRVVKSR